jgi:hypothetical protein
VRKAAQLQRTGGDNQALLSLPENRTNKMVEVVELFFDQALTTTSVLG